jgi:choline dehydrogenase-like flavoprotein
VGGTSAFYAAALERPEPHDLDDSAERPHPTGGWPVSYAEFRPYYEQAERMYCVSGDGNPLAEDEPAFLRTPPALSKGDAALMESFRRRGLHPYRMHLGVRDVSGCQECFGRICARTCKMDGRTAGVEPALLTGRAALLERCQVVALRGTPSRVTHVEAVRAGQPLTFRARRFVLAAGALGSPSLLLASASEAWPRGCANESGLVGRNLMFHLSEVIAIWPERVSNFKGFSRTIALRDLYYVNGRRFGIIQSLGVCASFGDILHAMNQKFDRTVIRRARPLRQFNRIPAMAAAKILGEARVFTGILEDLPYASNRVFLENGEMSSMRVKYDFSSELLERRELFRGIMKKSLKGLRSFFMTVEPELNFGHPCGTLRFGGDPGGSVLDASCRAHSVRNLYAADTSFMPTSMGVNPSLTTAANALRVADCMLIERS